MKINSNFEDELLREAIRMVSILPAIDKESSMESKRKSAIIITKFIIDTLEKVNNDNTLLRNGNNRSR